VAEQPTADPPGRAVGGGASRSALDVARLASFPPRLIVGAMALLASLVLFAELPGRPLVLHVLQKLAHPMVFAAIAIGTLALELQRTDDGRRVGVQYLRAFTIATLAGALAEVAQLFTHRDPSIRDVWLDARGAACALAFAMVFDARCRQGWKPTLRRTLLVAVGLGLAGWTLTPLAWTLAGYAERSERFPVLFQPATNLDLLFVGITAGSPELAHPPATIARSPQELALRVPLQARPYAGVTLDEPSADWRGYDRLAIEVGNAGRSELLLHVRVHDRTHDWTATDRFNGEVRIPGGERRTVEFPLEAIAVGPHDRPLDLGQIAGVALYRAGPEGPREFWLHRVELRRSP
jgi:VanZ family protein